MLKLQVITVSTRKGRLGPHVADWFCERATQHATFDVERIDLADVNLPLFDEPNHPRLGKYEHDHTKAWSAIVARADAYVFVTPEYDFSAPAALSNALQYLVNEWAYKAVGFASYGGVSAGTRGVQMSKQLVTALRMMPVVDAVAIPFFTQYLDKATGRFTPGDVQEKAATAMLDELVKWATALASLRGPEAAARAS
ncbi:MAG: NAD(P)H-dependent oxidoreductase [Gemmatimonadota bacterium]|nr:NAD(P)H-dependent oxidoreductase [Gemmatimonadota bacterium]